MEHKELARRVKERYPAYSNIPDDKLADLVIAKYPQYATMESPIQEMPETPDIPIYKEDDPSTWHAPTPEEEAIHRVGADPNQSFGQNLVESMLDPSEAATMALSGGVSQIAKQGVKQGIKPIAKNMLSWGTYGGSDVVKGAKNLVQEGVRGAGAKALETTQKFIPKGGTQVAGKVPTAPITAKTVKSILPESVEKQVSAVTKKFTGSKDTDVNKKSWDVVWDYWDRVKGTEHRMRNKWDSELRGKFSGDELEDMMYYREKTGNIFRRDDTYDAVKNRLSDDAKKVVDEVVDEHIHNSLKAWNASPFTKDIVAREEVQKIYLTHVYDGTLEPAYKHAMNVIKKKFKTNNPMRNKRTYLTFEDALKEKGLIPRYRNIADQLDYQDAFTTRLLANNELLGKTHQLEKEFGAKFIVRPGSKNYNTLLNEGWEQFYDPFLRTYVTGKGKDGSLKMAVHNGPALLHPDYADAVRSIFQKDVYKPENIAWRGYDTFNNWVRNLRVTLSGFHFVPLAESLVGGKGLKSLNIKEWWNAADKILKDPDVVGEMIGAGLRLRSPKEVSQTQIERTINTAVKKLALKDMPTSSKILKNVAKPYMWMQDLLWNKYHPRLKASVFTDYKTKWIAAAEKQGKQLSPEDMKQGMREIASLVNDQFGHQAWELMKHFNNPKVQKGMHRLLGYPDWTISALRQAGSAFQGGLRGKLGREYWARYGVGFVVGQNIANYITTGFYTNPDMPGNIGWDWERAHSTFENDDPTHKFDFQLPDVDIDVLGIKFNPGRETKDDGTPGRKYFSHLGKQMLEIPRYFPIIGDTIGQLFAKSAPLIQVIGKQLMGGSPYEGNIFPAQGEYVEGGYKSWGGKEGVGQAIPRAKQVVEDVLPFSIQQIRNYGIGTASMTPISKGISGYKAVEYFKDYIKDGDYAAQAGMRKLLRDYGYSSSYISSIMTRARKRARDEKK